MGDLSQFSLLDLFHIEVTTQVAVLNEGLLALEGSGFAFGATDLAPKLAPDLAPDLAALMRAAHSISPNCPDRCGCSIGSRNGGLLYRLCKDSKRERIII